MHSCVLLRIRIKTLRNFVRLSVRQVGLCAGVVRYLRPVRYHRQIESMFKNKTVIVSFQGILSKVSRQVEANMKELPKIPRLESSKQPNQSLTGMTLMSGSIF